MSEVYFVLLGSALFYKVIKKPWNLQRGWDHKVCSSHIIGHVCTLDFWSEILDVEGDLSACVQKFEEFIWQDEWVPVSFASRPACFRFLSEFNSGLGKHKSPSYAYILVFRWIHFHFRSLNRPNQLLNSKYKIKKKSLPIETAPKVTNNRSFVWQATVGVSCWKFSKQCGMISFSVVFEKSRRNVAVLKFCPLTWRLYFLVCLIIWKPFCGRSREAWTKILGC